MQIAELKGACFEATESEVRRMSQLGALLPKDLTVGAIYTVAL
jgi:hypothetical protein